MPPTRLALLALVNLPIIAIALNVVYQLVRVSYVSMHWTLAH